MNVRSRLAGALLASTAALCAVNVCAQSPPKDLAKRVDAYLAPLAAMDLFRGSVLIGKGGKVLFERSYGDIRAGTPIAATTQFKLLSISKTLTTALLMRFVQDGKLQLDDPVGKHLPGWPAAWRAVTVHQLLEHRSGLPVLQNEWETAQRQAGRGRRAWPDFAKTVQSSALLTPPGTEYFYNNWNHEVAGLIQEHLADADYAELLQAQLFTPLGMTETRCDDGAPHDTLANGHQLERDGTAAEIATDLSQLIPSVGICSTTGDLYRFDRALAQGEFLTPETQKLMFTARHGHACSWLIQTLCGRPCQRHGGGVRGYALDLLRFPADDACVILLGNLGYAPTVRISEDLVALLFGKPCVQPQRIDAAAMQRCSGLFEGPDGQLLALRNCGTMLVRFLLKVDEDQVGGQLLLPLGKDTFAEAAGDVSLALLRKGAQLRRTVSGNPTTWRRSVEVAAKWQALAGPWQTTPDLGSAAQLQVTDGAIALQFALGPDIPIVPISDSRALLLYDPQKATVMVRDGEVLRCKIGETDFVLRRQR